MNIFDPNASKILIFPEENLEFYVDKGLPESETDLTIANNSDMLAAYKIKSSSPADFTIIKSEGIIKPMQKQIIKIIYKVSESSYYKFHKFLLQTKVIQDANYIDWKANGVHEYKLCAKFHAKEYEVEKIEEVELILEQKLEEVENQKEVKIDSPIILNDHIEKKPRAYFQKKFTYVHLFLSFVLGGTTTYLIYGKI